MTTDEKSRFDQGYDAGFEKGSAERADLTLLTERYNYLQLGGTWLVSTEPLDKMEAYIEGFADAMRTLGMKP